MKLRLVTILKGLEGEVETLGHFERFNLIVVILELRIWDCRGLDCFTEPCRRF
jgi:hypothetical protein